MDATKVGSNNKWVRVSARAHAVIAQIHGVLQTLPADVKPTSYGDTVELILLRFLDAKTATQAALKLVSMYDGARPQHEKHTLPVQSVSINGID